ncbi:MAG: WD40 repeat domain-containing protein, partial [Akkermansiaceae bacterium]|nr:WD40 repeat domain-containing protein [Akkermansiaceae bacterium]
MEKDRRRRYETANAFALDLERYLKDDPIEARPPSTGYRLKKFARRHKPALATAATILIILVAASIISTVSAIRASQANQRSTENLADLQTAYTDLDLARGEAESQRNEAIWNEYVARQFPLRQAWKERNFGHLERLLEELEPAPGQPDFRGWEWGYYKDQCDQAFTTIPGRLPVWNPADGNLAVVRDRDQGGSEIVLVSPHDGSLVRTLVETSGGADNAIYNLRWCGDGSRLAYLTFGGVASVVDAATARPIFERQIPMPQRVPFDGPEVRGLDLNHDGSLLVTGTWAGNIQLWNLDAPGNPRLIQAADRKSHIHSNALRLSPHGKLLAGALRWGRRTTWDLKSGEAFEYTPRSVTSSGTIAWNRSGDRFAVTDADIDSVGIYRPGQQTPLATLSHPGVFGISWIGDGQLATLGSDQIVRIWDAGSSDPITTFRVISKSDFYQCSPAPDPAGELLAIPENGKVRIAKLIKPVPRFTTLVPEQPLRIGERHRIEWDPEDHYLASWHEVMITPENWETKIRVWDTRKGSLTSEHETGLLGAIGWDPKLIKIR